MLVNSREVLQLLKSKKVGSWNRAPDTSTRSSYGDDASNRIFDGFADIRPTYAGPRFTADVPVFAMGSCFAREIEAALVKRGGNVTSLDETIQRPEFQDETGHVRSGFFHRYTPTSMLQEFRWPFGRQETWSEDALIFDAAAGEVQDLNYPPICADKSPAATRTRREIAGALVRKVCDARIIIVTLGLTEGWVDLPTGLAVNSMNVRLLRQIAERFALHQIEYGEVMESTLPTLTPRTRTPKARWARTSSRRT